jgi:hypothetical protein
MSSEGGLAAASNSAAAARGGRAAAHRHPRAIVDRGLSRSSARRWSRPRGRCGRSSRLRVRVVGSDRNNARARHPSAVGCPFVSLRVSGIAFAWSRRHLNPTASPPRVRRVRRRHAISAAPHPCRVRGDGAVAVDALEVRRLRRDGASVEWRRGAASGVLVPPW